MSYVLIWTAILLTLGCVAVITDYSVAPMLILGIAFSLFLIGLVTGGPTQTG